MVSFNNAGALANVEYAFIAIAPWSTLAMDRIKLLDI